jgi:GT2 family glycosyltransferase
VSVTLSPDITVVIVSYNVLEYLQACLNSLLAQKGVVTEIIVVDNGSSDSTVEILHQKFPSVKVIANTINKGFSGANNQGILEAQGEYIFMLNPDTELKDENVLLVMKEYLRSHSNVGMVAPCLLNTDNSFQPSFWPLPGAKELFFELVYLHKAGKKKMPLTATIVGAVSGAAMFFNKSLLANAVGGFDEDMFWMEDTDLCYRVNKTGKEIAYLPNVKVVHHGGKSSTNYLVVIPNQVLSKIKFFKKNGSIFQYVSVNIMTFIFIISRLIIFTLLSVTGNEMWGKKRSAYTVAFGSYFRYNFSDNKGIIR